MKSYFLSLALLFASLVYLQAQQIVDAEYFIDVDPGVGNGTPLDWPDGEISLPFEVNPGTLPTGSHVLVVRVKNDLGEWSLSQSAFFYVQEPLTSQVPNPTPIVQLEYFLGNDPGVGNATSVSLGAQGIAVEQAISTAVGTVSAGIQTGGVRVKDQVGRWSITWPIRFFVQNSMVDQRPAPKNLKVIEYFFDSPDPGYGNGNLVVVPANQSSFTVEDILTKEELLELGLGRHVLNTRTQNEDGTWSLTEAKEFDFCPEEGVIPGFEVEVNGTRVTIIDSSEYAVEYAYLMDDPTQFNIIDQASFTYQYGMGGTYTICQNVINNCATKQTCQTITIEGPVLDPSFQTYTLNFQEDAPPVLVLSDINQLITSPTGQALTFRFEGANQAVGEFRNGGQELWIGPYPDFSGDGQSARLIITEGGTDYFVRFRLLVSQLPDPPIFIRPFEDLEVLEDADPLELTNSNLRRDMRFYVRDFEEDIMRFDVVSDTSGVIPEFIPTENPDSVFLQLSFAPDYYGTAEVIISANDSVSHWPDPFQTSYDTVMVRVKPIVDPPRLVKTIPNAALDEGFGEVIWVEDLNEHFSDPDPVDVLTFSASSDNPEIFVSVVNGKELKISADEDYSGQARITVFASDGFLRGETAFNVSISIVNDPPIWELPENFTFCTNNNGTFNFGNLLSDDLTVNSRLQLSARVLSVQPSDLPASTLSISFPSNSEVVFNSPDKNDGLYEVEMLATDHGGLTGSAIWLVDAQGATIRFRDGRYEASLGDSYQWFANGERLNGETGRFYSGNQVQNLRVEVTQGNCTVLSGPLTITGIDDLLLDELQIYPNPAAGAFQIEIVGSLRGAFQLELFDLSGRSVLGGAETYQKTTEAITIQKQLGSLSSGTYLVRVSANGAYFHQKLVVK